MLQPHGTSWVILGGRRVWPLKLIASCVPWTSMKVSRLAVFELGPLDPTDQVLVDGLKERSGQAHGMSLQRDSAQLAFHPDAQQASTCNPSAGAAVIFHLDKFMGTRSASISGCGSVAAWQSLSWRGATFGGFCPLVQQRALAPFLDVLDFCMSLAEWIRNFHA